MLFRSQRNWGNLHERVAAMKTQSSDGLATLPVVWCESRGAICHFVCLISVAVTERKSQCEKGMHIAGKLGLVFFL